MPMAQQQQSPQGSALQSYMTNYGARLQSMLAGPTAAGPAAQPSALTDPAQVGAPTSAQQPVVQEASGGTKGSQGGDSDFRRRWQETSPDEQRDFADKLEASLAKGNQTIDSAYDELVKQMGTRPASDEKLSREEKGMLLMEFGLSLMANSSGQAYGRDTAGAIGASGLTALQGHRARREGQRTRYDESRLDVEKSRAGAKARLAEQSALEARAYERDRRREEREGSQIAGIVYGADDMAYGYTRGGDISRLEQPGGEGVRARPPASRSGTGSTRKLAEDRRYELYMETYGKDSAGNPLTGETLEQVKRRALAFSADPRSATLSDAEMRTMAERSADAFMKSNWSLFQDMTPDQARAWRDKTADENFNRLKSGRDVELTPPTAPAPRPPRRRAPGGGSALSKRNFASQAEIESAVARGEVEDGDTVRLNGRPFKVQVQ